MRHIPQRGGARACNGLLTRSDRSGGATTLARASSSKPRSISAAPFRDRVVHHALTHAASGLRMGARASGSSKDNLEAFLCEMMVVGQDLRNSMAAHSRHGYAVYEAVTFVITLLVPTQARQKGFARLLRPDRHARIVQDLSDGADGRLAQMVAAAGQSIQKLGQDFIGRDKTYFFRVPYGHGVQARDTDRADEVPPPSTACPRRPASLLLWRAVEVLVKIREVVRGDLRPLSGRNGPPNSRKLGLQRAGGEFLLNPRLRSDLPSTQGRTVAWLFCCGSQLLSLSQ